MSHMPCTEVPAPELRCCIYRAALPLSRALRALTPHALHTAPARTQTPTHVQAHAHTSHKLLSPHSLPRALGHAKHPSQPCAARHARRASQTERACAHTRTMSRECPQLPLYTCSPAVLSAACPERRLTCRAARTVQAPPRRPSPSRPPWAEPGACPRRSRRRT